MGSGKKLKFWYNGLFVLSFLSLFSCINNKRIAYLQNVPDSTVYRAPEVPYVEPPIQPDDILSIAIQTIDPQNATLLNQLGSSAPTTVNPAGQAVSGYLVDKDGVVEVPMIGKIKVAGLSTFKARDVIKEKASVYFKNPTVIVRFANFKVTVLGEVSKPGTYTLPNERVSVLDVLGLAGDLTIYGKRDNIMIIRQNGKEKEIYRLNLKSTDMFKSPYFFVKQNDIIYIEPSRAKVAALNQARTQTIAIVSSVLTLLFVVVSRINF